MRLKLGWFLLISVLFHLLLFSFMKIEKPKKKEQPISIEIIEKEKERPAPRIDRQEPAPPEPLPSITPEVKPEKIEITPDDSVSSETIKTKPGGVKEQKLKKTEELVKQPNIKESLPKQLEKPMEKLPDLPKMDFADRGAVAGLDKKAIDNILNPKDIINKAAKGSGNDVEGEDSVSMQEIKTRYTSYFYKFRRQLYQVWIYPNDAGLRGEQGTVNIRFAIHKDGKITDIQVVRSSGYPDLDNEAVKALKKMGGVPLPDSYNLNVLRVDGYFVYYLSGAVDIY